MLNITKNLLLIYLILKPYYLFNSGSLQIADSFLLMAFVFVCVLCVSSPRNRKIIVSILQKNKLFIIFAGMTIAVNCVYFLASPDIKFLMSSLYYIFNMIAIITFSAFLLDKTFLKKMGAVFKVNLVIQLMVWSLQLGRYDSPERYMGTLNDPNQFGYYVLLSLLFIFVIDVILNKKRSYIYYLLSVFLIYISGSTGMLLGLSVFSLGFLTYFVIRQLKAPYDFVRKIVYILAVILVTLIPILLFLNIESNQPRGDIATVVEESFLFSRTDEKLQKTSGNADISIFEDRGLDTIFKYPEYILLGSGEGNFSRFDKVTNNYGNEIHSTFPSILFYYGIIPFLVLMGWLYRQVKGLKMVAWVILLPLFVTSFTLLNQRQVLFWVLIVLVGLYLNKKVTGVKDSLGTYKVHGG